ncbi:EpsG family protein [Erwinia rhapontici]|uniref:EpsG family protein n=1 Tax=Erwinia rhapontici TaxID=55212 RepID=UPI001D0D9397|nr:EpsG family protein [Erwinia rhapontici]UDQ78794.1 EpsG family protein [Erwinia rhapontici]
MAIYLTGYLTICFFSWLSLDVSVSSNVKKWMFFFVATLLLFFCAARGVIDRDHQSYLNIYKHIIDGVDLLIEPTFYFFSYISSWLTDGPQLIFIIYALLGLSLKFYSIRKFSVFPLVSVLIYFSNYYFLHEMTQIRVGVSVSLALIAITNWFGGNKKNFFIIIFLSLLFHYSALIFLMVPLVSKERVHKKEMFFYTCLIVFLYALYVVNFGFARVFSYIPIGYVQEKFSIYYEKTRLGEVDAVNAFSVMQLIRLIIIYLVCFFCPKECYADKFFNVMLRFYIFSAICWVMFFDIPVFAVRLSEILGVAEIFVIPYIIYVSRKKYIGLIVISLITAMMFFVNIYYSKLMLPYVPFWAESFYYS